MLIVGSSTFCRSEEREFDCKFTTAGNGEYFCYISCSFKEFDTDPILKFTKSAHIDEKNDDDVVRTYISNQNVPYLPSQLGGPFKNIRNLKVHNSGVKYVQRKSFLGLLGLVILELRDNAIESIPESAFWDLNHLEYLSLHNNKIQNLEPKLFSRLLCLNFLTFASNQINALEDNIFENNPNLVELDAENNLLKYHKKAIANLQKLSIKRFGGNPLLDGTNDEFRF